ESRGNRTATRGRRAEAAAASRGDRTRGARPPLARGRGALSLPDARRLPALRRPRGLAGAQPGAPLACPEGHAASVPPAITLSLVFAEDVNAALRASPPRQEARLLSAEPWRALRLPGAGGAACSPRPRGAGPRPRRGPRNTSDQAGGGRPAAARECSARVMPAAWARSNARQAGSCGSGTRAAIGVKFTRK